MGKGILVRLQIDRMSLDDNGLLGPGKRIEIWLHGCHRNCPGCITEAHNHTPEAMLNLSTGLVLDYILQDDDVEGITVSGGEPLNQAEALLPLLEDVRRAGLGCILYTGYTLEEIPGIPFGEAVIHQVDVCIDGPYIPELDDSKAFRGSSNQRIHHFTERYRNYFENPRAKRLSIVEQQGEYFTLTGIPTNEAKSFWRFIKGKGDF